jgi:hypothetical protein
LKGGLFCCCGLRHRFLRAEWFRFTKEVPEL